MDVSKKVRMYFGITSWYSKQLHLSIKCAIHTSELWTAVHSNPFKNVVNWNLRDRHLSTCATLDWKNNHQNHFYKAFAVEEIHCMRKNLEKSPLWYFSVGGCIQSISILYSSNLPTLTMKNNSVRTLFHSLGALLYFMRMKIVILV